VAGSLNHIRRTAVINHCLLLPSEQHAGGYQPASHLALHFNFCQSLHELPFPCRYPDRPAALLQDLRLFALTDTGLEDQFSVILCCCPVGEAGRTPVHLHASHSFMEAQFG